MHLNVGMNSDKWNILLWCYIIPKTKFDLDLFPRNISKYKKIGHGVIFMFVIKKCVLMN